MSRPLCKFRRDVWGKAALPLLCQLEPLILKRSLLTRYGARDPVITVRVPRFYIDAIKIAAAMKSPHTSKPVLTDEVIFFLCSKQRRGDRGVGDIE